MPNTFVLVHYPTMYTKPVGIWWWNDIDKCPTSYYVPDASNYHDLVVDLLGQGKNKDQWQTWAQTISDRVPASDAFQADTIHISPVTYLKSIRSGAYADANTGS